MYGNTSFRSFIIGCCYLFHCLLFMIDPDPAKRVTYTLCYSQIVTKPITVKGNPLVSTYLAGSQSLSMKERQYGIYK